MKLLCQAATGLNYLHYPTAQKPRIVIHGDLKGSNLLINEIGEVCLSDFGLSKKIRDELEPPSGRSTSTFNMSLRWLAPEVLKDLEKSRFTVRSDIYALGCVCFELVTGSLPYSQYLNEAAVAVAIWNGEQPKRPSGEVVSDELWAVIQQCWDEDPTKRPSSDNLITLLKGVK